MVASGIEESNIFIIKFIFAHPVFSKLLGHPTNRFLGEFFSLNTTRRYGHNHFHMVLSAFPKRTH